MYSVLIFLARTLHKYRTERFLKLDRRLRKVLGWQIELKKFSGHWKAGLLLWGPVSEGREGGTRKILETSSAFFRVIPSLKRLELKGTLQAVTWVQCSWCKNVIIAAKLSSASLPRVGYSYTSGTSLSSSRGTTEVRVKVVLHNHLLAEW